MAFIMSKKVQIIISFIMLFCCVCAIIYNINFKREVNEIKSDDAFLNMQDDIDVENTDIYDEFLKNFDTQGEKYYYSFIELVGYDYPILLLSNGVYGEEVALWTDVYYPINNEIIKFGTLMSVGTAYPISANTTGIFTAGGHEVSKYDLDIQNQKLRLISEYLVFFYKVEQEVKAITVGIIGNENKIVSQDDFDKANKEYGDAKIILFKRL